MDDLDGINNAIYEDALIDGAEWASETHDFRAFIKSKGYNLDDDNVRIVDLFEQYNAVRAKHAGIPITDEVLAGRVPLPPYFPKDSSQDEKS